MHATKNVVEQSGLLQKKQNCPKYLALEKMDDRSEISIDQFLAKIISTCPLEIPDIVMLGGSILFSH